MALGKDITEEVIETRLSSILPGHCSTLIYTSGKECYHFYPVFCFLVLDHTFSSLEIMKISPFCCRSRTFPRSPFFSSHAVFCLISSYHVLPRPTFFYSSYIVSSSLTMSYLILPCLDSSYIVLSYFAMSYLILTRLTLLYLILSYMTLPCPQAPPVPPRR
jgi:hypothetical protein